MAVKQKHLYSPFKRNQMRWALVIYKWKTGCSWNQYHLYMADELGEKDLGDFEQKISNKDVKRFVVEGRKTSEEKLEIFEKFIRKVLPDYLTDGNEEDHLLSTAKSMAEFSGVGFRFEEYAYWLGNKIPLESIFISPIMDEGSVSISSIDCCVLRPISDSPFLFIQMYTVDLPREITLLPSKLRFLEKSTKPEDYNKVNDLIVETLRTVVQRLLKFNDKGMEARDYRRGITVPVGSEHHYSVMKTQDECPDLAKINGHTLGDQAQKFTFDLMSEYHSFDNRQDLSGPHIPTNLKISALRDSDARDEKKERSYERYYLKVDGLTNIKEFVVKTRFSLL